MESHPSTSLGAGMHIRDLPGEMTDPSSLLASQLIVQSFARLRPVALGASLGVVTGALLGGATLTLLVRAVLESDPSQPIGPHLGLLAQYLPGYSVSWSGTLVGIVYGLGCGFAAGSAMAVLLNLSHALHLRLLERRLRRGAMLDGV